MKTLYEIREDLKALLSDLELIIGKPKENDDLIILGENDIDLSNMSIDLNGQHAQETYTISDSYDDFKINFFSEESLDNTKKY